MTNAVVAAVQALQKIATMAIPVQLTAVTRSVEFAKTPQKVVPMEIAVPLILAILLQASAKIHG